MSKRPLPPSNARGKKLQERVTALTTSEEVPVELWCEDEARLGLKPIVRNVWALRGQRPVAPNHPRYEWLYVYGFVCPATGQTYWLILPTVTTIAMNLALAEFARDLGVGSTKRILLVLDKAGWHHSTAVVVPTGLELLYLPAATPELQPAERLWPLMREAVANTTFPSLMQLQDVLVTRCEQLASQAELIHGATNYHWWPAP